MSNLPPAEQLPLLDLSALPAGADILPEYQHRFTGERVARNQARYREIVRAIAEGLSVRSICAIFSVSHHTVARIREVEPDLVAAEKGRLAKLMMRAARTSVESYLEDLEIPGKVTPQVKSIAAGIFTDKGLLLAGEATARIEHGGARDLEEFRRRLAAIPEARVTISSEVSSVSASPSSLPETAVLALSGPGKGPLGPVLPTSEASIVPAGSDADLPQDAPAPSPDTMTQTGGRGSPISQASENSTDPPKQILAQEECST